MLENPGDELYFGEVYRRVLQESWLPDGAVDWERLGKSTRGWRPTQRGLEVPQVSPSQAIVRQCFSLCAASIRDLPWQFPPGRTCDNRQGRRYWSDEKEERGLTCSYYDLYMRSCMRSCLDTGCLPPADYLLQVQPSLTGVECNQDYTLTFPNKCGDISFVSGTGSFSPPSTWTAPPCGTEGELCFVDANGSLGATTYTFSPEHWCEPFFWPDTNPDTIDAGSSEQVWVSGGVPPFTWSVVPDSFHLASTVTSSRSNTLFAPYPCSVTAFIHVEDYCGNSTDGTLQASLFGWCICGSMTTGGPPNACGPGSFDIMQGIYRLIGACDSVTGPPDIGGNCLSVCGEGADGVSFRADDICGGGDCDKFKHGAVYVWIG